MKKTLLTIVLTVLICCTVMGTTLALLADKTTAIENTFTVGNIDITLTETGADVNGKQSFKMVPGATLTKDPTVTVEANSEACYLYIYVAEANNTFGDPAEKYVTYTLDGWTELGNAYPGVYYRAVPSSATAQTFSVFSGNVVKVSNKITKSQADALNAVGAQLPTLTVTAFAVQSENTGTAAEAFGAVFADYNS